MTVLVLLFLGGSIGLGFALQSLQLLELRRSLIRLRSDMSLSRRERNDELAEYRLQRRLAEGSTPQANPRSDSKPDRIALLSAVGAETD